MKSKPFHRNIVALACENDVFRRVLVTTEKTQLVLMAIPPGGDVGEHEHANTEQLLFCSGQAVLEGARSAFVPGDVLVIPAGTRHNVRNTGEELLRLYTVYSPPNHLPGRVHATKKDAECDADDEAVEKALGAGNGRKGRKVPVERLGIRDRQIGEVKGLTVWLVSGRVIRDHVDVDFTTGGNHGRYGYVPEGELWIEATLSPADVAATTVHEASELVLMRLGYEKAHAEANGWEKKARRKLLGARLATREAAVEWAADFLERAAQGSV